MYIHELSYNDGLDHINNYIYCLDSTLNSGLDEKGCLHFNSMYDARLASTADLSYEALKSSESITHLTFEVDGSACATKKFWNWGTTLSPDADITMYQVKDGDKITIFEGHYEYPSEESSQNSIKGKYYWEGQKPGYDADLSIDPSWVKFYQDLGEFAAQHFYVVKATTTTQEANLDLNF